MAPKKAEKVRRPKSEAEAVYFLSLTVRNIRCFGDAPQKLDLSDRNGHPAQWTLILGNNGTGKTTLLQLLSGFDGVEVDSQESKQWRSSEPRWWASFAHRRIEWFIRRSPIDQANFSAETATQVGGLQHGDLIGRSVFSIDRDARGFPSVLGHESTIPDGVQCEDLPRCFGYSAARRNNNEDLSSDRKWWESDPTANLFDDDASLCNAEEWLRELDYSASKESEIAERQRERFKQVQRLLIDLLPDVSDIRITTPSRLRPTPEVEFKTHYGWVPYESISHGYQTMVSWVVDFASRLVGSARDDSNPLAQPAVCLIDEIDLHLHPTWQREVVSYLTERFPNTQFIATAHSPLIVQAATSVNANVAVLRRVGDHVVIDNDPEIVRGWRLDQILASDLYNVPARAPDVQAKIDERRKILEKPKLSKGDKQKLKELEAEIGLLPVGETREQIRAMELLQDSVSALKSAVEREA